MHYNSMHATAVAVFALCLSLQPANAASGSSNISQVKVTSTGNNVVASITQASVVQKQSAVAHVTPLATPISVPMPAVSVQSTVAQVRSDWTKLVDPSKLPAGVGPKAVGSGVCASAVCGPGDCKKCWESCGTCPEERDVYGCSKSNQWALTFDDGPSPNTSVLLDILDKLKIKVTFFFLGSNVVQYSSVVKRAYDAGHLIASHTWSHPHLMSLPDDQIISEVKMSEEAIFNVTGTRPAYIRPPYGEADERVKAIFKQLGYRAILWNMDCKDYAVVETKQDTSKILQAFQDAFVKPTGLNSKNDPGFISLQHDLYLESVNLEDKIASLIRDKGFALTTVAECVGDASPYQSLVQDTKGKVAKKQPGNAGDSVVSITASSGVPGDWPLASSGKHSNYFLVATSVTGLMAVIFSVYMF